MSIRRVSCPACKATANVPVTMTHIKCPGCGKVWNANDPDAAVPMARSPASAQDERSNGGNAAVFATVAGAVVLLAIAGIALVLFLPRETEPDVEPAAATSEVAAVEAGVDEQLTSYREVDLPESLRKQIYHDYRRMAQSSIEKKLMAPKGSPVRNSVEGMLKQTADREVTHFALIHKISEDDVLQIVAEGDAKQWPGARKAAKPVASK